MSIFTIRTVPIGIKKGLKWIFFPVGTNWIFEVISMIVRRKAERFKDMKGVTMLEKEPEENINNFPMSPKVLNTHVNYKYVFTTMYFIQLFCQFITQLLL